MALDDLLGNESEPVRVVIERAPVRVFAESLGDKNVAYRDSDSGEPGMVPATFPFAMPYWGSQGTGGAATLPMERLRGRGRLILHGEQEFEYFRWPKIGDELEGITRVTEVDEKEKSNGGKMERYVTETQWRDIASGDLAVTTRFTLLVMVKGPPAA